MNVLTRNTTATAKRSAPSFSLATILPGAQAASGGNRLPRGVLVAGGLMALTIVALAAALVMKSGESSAPPVAQPLAAQGATFAPPEQAAAPAKLAGAGTQAGPSTAGPAANPVAQPTQVAAAPVCPNCGVIESYSPVKVQGATNGVGAVAGGIGGAVIGSKIAGRGNHTVGGLVGAIGGGLLGNAVEKHVRVYTMYDVQVRMDDGSVRTVRQSAAPAVGSRVTVDGKTLHAAPAAPVAPTVAPTAPVGNGGAAT